jgi:hypothetical protein
MMLAIIADALQIVVSRFRYRSRASSPSWLALGISAIVS